MITVLRRPVVKQCPYKDETDAGELVITLDGPAPELHALGQRIDMLAAEPISHEDFTQQVAGMLPGAEIVTAWHTGPWDVEVRETAQEEPAG